MPFIFRISRIIFKLRSAVRSTIGQVNCCPADAKRAPPPIWERRSFNLVIFIFNLVMCAVNGAIFTLWAISAPLTGTLAGTLAPPGTAQRRRGNCTTTRREPQRTTQQRRGTTQKHPGTVENCTTTPGNCAKPPDNLPLLFESPFYRTPVMIP